MVERREDPMTLTQARQHRTRLQTILKRRQYAALAGYVSRELRGEQELSRMCFAFVPLLIEAILEPARRSLTGRADQGTAAA